MVTEATLGTQVTGPKPWSVRSGKNAPMLSLATFRLSGSPGLAASSVSARLDLVPTQLAEAGEPLGGQGAVRERAVWMLASADSPQDGTELGDHLGRILDVLEPKRALLWELTEDGWEADWFCYVGSRALEHAVSLDRGLMQRLVAMPGDLLLDVYGDD